MKKVRFSDDIIIIRNIVSDEDFDIIYNYKYCYSNIDFINGLNRRRQEQIKKYKEMGFWKIVKSYFREIFL